MTSPIVTSLVALGVLAAPRPTAPVITGNLHPSAASPHSYVFASIERGVAASRIRYRCSLDRPALHACPRKVTFRFTPGTHVLRAQALDPAGHASAVSHVTIVAEALVPALPVRQAWQVDVSGGAGVDTYGSLALAPSGEIVIGDPPKDRILVYGGDGTLRRTWGSHGDGPGQFDFARATDEPPGVEFATVAVDSRNGNVYVAETQRIQRFDPQGAYQLGWGPTGTGDGQFTRVVDLAIDPSGVVSALEDRPTSQGRVQRFSAEGLFLSTFGRGQILDSGGIELDPAGDTIVSDDHANRLDVFGPTGALLRSFGEPGTAPGQLDFPTGLSLDRGTLYVADSHHFRIVAFDLASGRPTGYWPTAPRPYGVVADGAGDVYVLTGPGLLTRYVLP
jgi:DNA-binding beta-propeller fold protein YncE